MMNPAFTTVPQMRRPLASLACSRNQVMLGSDLKWSSAVAALATSFCASALVGAADAISAAVKRISPQAMVLRTLLIVPPPAAKPIRLIRRLHRRRSASARDDLLSE